MDNLATHIRICSLTPTNDDVDARRAAISALSGKWEKMSDPEKIMGKAEMIAGSLGGDGHPNEKLGLEVQEALQEHASAFLYTESPLDVGVCAGCAALAILSRPPGDTGWTAGDVYSNVLWSALGFQSTLMEHRRERLRREVLDLAGQRSRSAADKVRERVLVPDMGDLSVTMSEEDKYTTTFKKATKATIDALRRNAALDREEIDFLWWVQLNRSRLLKRHSDSMSEPLRLVAFGIEAASHLRRLPADLHYDLVLRTVDKDPELDLKELIELIGDDRQLLAGSFNKARVAAHSAIFPLLYALSTGEVSVSGGEVRRKASEWAGRALLEASLNRMCDNGAGTL